MPEVDADRRKLRDDLAQLERMYRCKPRRAQVRIVDTSRPAPGRSLWRAAVAAVLCSLVVMLFAAMHAAVAFYDVNVQLQQRAVFTAHDSGSQVIMAVNPVGTVRPMSPVEKAIRIPHELAYVLLAGSGTFFIMFARSGSLLRMRKTTYVLGAALLLAALALPAVLGWLTCNAEPFS